METLRYLWNVVKFFNNKPELKMNNLQAYYVDRCRDLKSHIKPRENMFSPSMMCSHCDSFWARDDPKIRLAPSRRPGKSVQKLIKKKENSARKLRKVKRTLIKKAKKNSGNKIVIKCSNCSEYTKIHLTRPPRLKPVVIKTPTDNSTSITKKRKKRTKDKTAGLIINGNRNSGVNQKTLKVKVTDVDKLKAAFTKNLIPSKKSSLHSFITELT